MQIVIIGQFSFILALRSNAGYGLLIHEVSRSHTTVGLLWTSDHLVAETTT